MSKPLTPSLKSAMEITKGNNVILLSGQRAASWLAAQSCHVGLHAPMTYPHEEEGIVVKIHSHLCVVAGEGLVTRLLETWTVSPSDETVLHTLDEDQQGRVLMFCKAVPVWNE